MHETVTFLSNDTTREDFIYDGSPLGGEELLQTGRSSYVGGFVKVAGEFEQVELIGITSPMYPRTGIGSGWITSDAYEWFVNGMLRELKAALPLEGVYLALHGAMAVRGVPQPESDLARRVRKMVGSSAVIVATFDPHGNEDETFFEGADLAFAAKYYPHYDEYLQGTRAARALIRSIRGDYRPVWACCKVPILAPTVSQWTGASPWSDLVQRALIWEARSPDLYVNVFFGFPWSDVVDVGMTFQAISNGDSDLAQTAVTDLAKFAWRKRRALVSAARPRSIREGVKRARTLSRNSVVVIADHSDRSGGATWVLKEVLDQDLSRTLIATVADRTLGQRLDEIGAKPGDYFDMTVGGGLAESDGAPVRVVGTMLRIVRTRSPAEHAGISWWAIIDFGRQNTLIVTPYLAQISEPAILTTLLGLDLSKFAIIALKSRVHFRRGFTDSGLAQHAIVVQPEQPFLGTTKLEALRYEHLDLTRYYPYGDRAFTPYCTSGIRRQ
jgi:microcystin degradation protein MlrC